MPLDDHPAYRQIANVIEQRIVGRSLRTGDPLPSETDLARQFGVNRSTIREAIRELETHGLLGRVRGEKRLRVTRPEPRRVSSGVSRALALHDVTFLELWEAMMAIEPVAAQYAAARRTPAAAASPGARRLRASSAKLTTPRPPWPPWWISSPRSPRRAAIRCWRLSQAPAQPIARPGAHPYDRSGAAGARAHPRLHRPRSPTPIKLSAQRASTHLDGKAHPRLQAGPRSRNLGHDRANDIEPGACTRP